MENTSLPDGDSAETKFSVSGMDLNLTVLSILINLKSAIFGNPQWTCVKEREIVFGIPRLGLRDSTLGRPPSPAVARELQPWPWEILASRRLEAHPDLQIHFSRL